MNDYEARQEARKQRLLNAAERMQSASDVAYNRARQMADVIPFGQPILVGHHSEKRDRNYRARIWRTQDRCLELQRKAEYFRGLAAGVGKAGISSDDPKAVLKLKEELAAREARQARMSAVNAAHKRYAAGKPWSSGLSEADQALIVNYKPAYSWEPHPFAPYQLSNNGANMRRIEQRIAALGKKQSEDVERDMGDGIGYREDVTENRVMLTFPGKPSEAVRGILKANGFKWSPTRGAWVRMLNNAGKQAAQYALECINRKQKEVA